MKSSRKITAIREFNRFYTNVLGLLDQYILESKYSLSEVRVLHEIENSIDCTPKKLSETLCMDAGYLSRILKQFEKSSFIEKSQSLEDGRSYFLHLTDQGRQVLVALNARSDKQIDKLVESLSESDQSKLIRSMNDIENVLTANRCITPEDITIRHELVPGDLGYLTHMHGWIYEQECQYPLAFEGYVAETFHNFMKTYDSDRDRIWFAMHNGEIVGSIGVVGHPANAQLRWFLLHPDYRGIGLGKRLFTKALTYCQQKKYTKVFLTTTEDQKQAIAMYVKAGFVKVAERKGLPWADLLEYTFELDLDK